MGLFLISHIVCNLPPRFSVCEINIICNSAAGKGTNFSRGLDTCTVRIRLLQDARKIQGRCVLHFVALALEAADCKINIGQRFSSDRPKLYVFRKHGLSKSACNQNASLRSVLMCVKPRVDAL